ncbi:hypothetical protein G6O69_18200 [Pseudenhygromyxa sp. WMMC2535]|uniref:WD40/YVTN/BNR-like repeat-containing protein n=1 Tax=Pseudenhygromyxa sp. WMMC2535 TaxID=2712867 RepID=UPI0015535975|nr:hypothetical protein [Pseudenhygromyxa sp. WMMC2535]NVB39782.1 hypothetical protein [Pseudenhygromyxa sp. WMMC2535]
MRSWVSERAGLLTALGLAAAACSRPSAQIDEPAGGAAAAQSSGEQDEPEAQRRMPSQATPACVAEIDGDLIVIGEMSTRLRLDDGVDRRRVRLQILPWDEDEILLAVGSQQPWWSMTQTGLEGRLWRVPCAEPKALELVVEVPEVDLSWSALDPEGGGLYFGSQAVQRYDFALGDWGPIASAPVFEGCWMAETAITGNVYVVEWLADGQLLVYEGGPCGFEAEWLGAAKVVEIDEAGEGHTRDLAHVASVTSDGQGQLWLADGGLCGESQTWMSRGSEGLWRSDDSGESWALIEIPDLEKRGLVAVWAEGDRLIAWEECCYSEAADFCQGGELFVSEDGGDSWEKRSPRHGQPAPNDYGPVDAVAVEPGFGVIMVEQQGYEGPLRMRSDDLGRSWSALEVGAAFEASAPSERAEVDGYVFEIGREGLYQLGADGGGRRQVWPRKVRVDR